MAKATIPVMLTNRGDRAPLGRLGAPDDIAWGAGLPASTEAAYLGHRHRATHHQGATVCDER